MEYHFTNSQFISSDTFPDNLKDELKEHYDNSLQADYVAVRSSVCDEDSVGSSFAGLHESYVNVHGFDATIKW